MASEIKTYPPVMGSSNLKAYYRFESGALTTDSSGAGHTLTAISVPVLGTGKFGGGIDFAGDDAYSAVDHADFKPTGNFTVGGWFKTSTIGSDQMIFASYSQNTETKGFFFYIRNSTGALSLAIGIGGGTTLGTHYQRINGETTTIRDGAWHFGVATWDGSNMNLYLDGNSDADAVAWSTPVYAATNYVRTGCYNLTGTNVNFLTGSLDDVFLLNGTALTAQQISDIYNERCNKFLQMF